MVKDEKLFSGEINEYLNSVDAFADRAYFQTKEMSIEDRQKASLSAIKVSKKILRMYLFSKLRGFRAFTKPLSAFLASDLVKTAYRKSTVVKRTLRWIGCFWGLR